MEKIVTPTPTPLLQLYRHYLACRSVCTDTRALTPGCLFFALRGETFNANLFATQALEKGAAYAVVDDPNVAAQDARMCYVPNVLTALQELAAYHRKQLGIPIFALTGTNGKTTTKELIHAALATTYRVTATQGNLNNHIGVPLTLLRMDAATEIGVVEMGANHIEEIAQLVAIAQPTAGLITNVGMAHLEGFGSLEGVMQCKGALYDYLKAHGGTILVDASNSLLTAMLHARSITNARPYPAVVPTPATIKAPTLVVEVPQVGQITTQLVGTYNAPNVGAALAAAELYHIPLEVAAQAIAAYIPTNHRSQWVRTPHNALIVDAYNANPTSMSAAVKSFFSLPAARRALILGDMRELGTQSAAAHQELVLLVQSLQEAAPETAPDAAQTRLFWVGPCFTQAVAQCGAPGVCVPHKEALLDLLRKQPLRGYTILLKGSNGIGLSHIAHSGAI